MSVDTGARSRFEVPALIVVDALDITDAETRARNLSRTISAEMGPGAFFCEIGVTPTDVPRGCEEDREEETVEQHVASILEARGE